MNKAFSIVIFLVILVLIAFGVYYMSEDGLNTGMNDGSGEEMEEMSEGENGEEVVELESITDEERAEILELPDFSNAKLEDLDAYTAMVFAASKDVNILDIGECKPTPVVLRIGLDEEIEVYNSDNVDHELQFFNGPVAIEAGGSQNIVANFGNEKGLEVYACDEEYPVGIVFIE